MNFLEQLVSEWYDYNDYYTKVNVKIGRRPAGGYEGELDVVAFLPDSNLVVHVETSMDALSWPDRRERFQRKFALGRKYIPDLFNRREMIIESHAILGYPRSTTLIQPLGPGIRLILMPEFIGDILSRFRGIPVERAAVPENLSLIRALQFAAQYGAPAFQVPKAAG